VKTAEIKAELSQLTSALNDFSLTGDQPVESLYKFEGKDYNKEKHEEIKATPNDFIELKREKTYRSGQYDIDKYYRKVLNQPTPNKVNKKKGWKSMANGGYEHQFYDTETLDKLDKKEEAWLEYLKLSKAEDCELKAPEEFTEADVKERERLIPQGFPRWGKKEFFLFIKACERFGRDRFDKIAGELVNKTEQDVKVYSKTFWADYSKIENGLKYIERIEKGEKEIKKLNEIQDILDWKFDQLFSDGKCSLEDIQITDRDSEYNEIEDQFMIY